MLNEKEKVWETSVFEVSGLRDDGVWQIARVHLMAGMTNRTLYGGAFIEASAIGEQGLAIYRDDNPPRHGAIRGWPDSESERKLRALRLAESATLQLL